MTRLEGGLSVWRRAKSVGPQVLCELGRPASLQTVVDVAVLHGRVIGTVETAA